MVSDAFNRGSVWAFFLNVLSAYPPATALILKALPLALVNLTVPRRLFGPDAQNTLLQRG